ncbi:MAG: hypothetical protein ABIF10_03435 [Candidatus Woesearchaeota archaeon]
MKKSNIIQNVKRALASAWHNKRYFVLSMMVDVAFAVVFVIVFSMLQMQIYNYLFDVVQMIQSAPAKALVTQPSFVYSLGEVVRYIAILMVAMYVIYGLFQGIAWMCCMKIVDRKWHKPVGYAVKFFLLNIVWISVLYSFIYTWVKLSVYAHFSMFPAASQDFMTGMLMSASLALAYFAIISYVLLKTMPLSKVLQKTLVLSFVKWKRLVPMFMVVLVAFLAMANIYYYIENTYLLLAVTVFFAVPLMTLLRVFVTTTVLKN